MSDYVSTSQGRLGYALLRAYSPSDVYNKRDLVAYQNGTYAVLKDGITGVTPVSDGLNYLMFAGPGIGVNNAAWFAGTEVAGRGSGIAVSVIGSKAGDMYLNNDTSDIYLAVAADTWDWKMNLLEGVDMKAEDVSTSGGGSVQEALDEHATAIADLGGRAAADIPTTEPGVSVQGALAGKAALLHAARHLAGGGDPLTVNLAAMVAGVLGIPNGGHGKPTRYEGMHNLFSAGAEWANDVNRATTTGLTITSQGWANLPNPGEPFGILLSFTSYPGPTSYGFCLQIWVGILSEEMYYRTGIDDERGFSAWVKASTSTIASGVVYISLAANTVGGVSVTVPSGVKHVVASPVTTTPQNVRVSSGTVEGTSVWIGAHSTTAQTLAVNWIAVG